MTYTIIDHGEWEGYKPETLPEGAPQNAQFARRVGDGVDWYQFARDPETFGDDPVIATLLPVRDIGLIAQAVVRDASLLFPAGQRLIQIQGVDPSIEKPHKLFEMRVCDVAAQTFSDITPPAVTQVSAAQAKTALYKAGLLSRVDTIVAEHPYEPVRIFYANANAWDITNPYVQAIAQELELDQAQLQALFNSASKQ